MHSHDDLARVSALLQRRSERVREYAAREARAADMAEAQAKELLEHCSEQTTGARLSEDEGLSRSALFDRLRAIAVTRAHVMECRLRHAQLVSKAADHRLQQRNLLSDASEHATRSRRLSEVYGKLSDAWRRRRTRRQEIEIQESIRWK